MAKAPLNIDVRNITTSDIIQIALAGPGEVLSGLHLVITNQSLSQNTISIYHNNGTEDFLLVSRLIPGGSGKTWVVSEAAGLKLNTGDALKVKASDDGDYNSNLSGSKTT